MASAQIAKSFPEFQNRDQPDVFARGKHVAKKWVSFKEISIVFTLFRISNPAFLVVLNWTLLAHSHGTWYQGNQGRGGWSWGEVQVYLCICSSVFVYFFPNNISSLPFLAGDKNCRQVVQGKCTETINPVSSSSSPKSLHCQLPFVMYSSHYQL